MRILKSRRLLLILLPVALILGIAGLSLSRATSTTSNNETQDLMNLDRRIGMLEQRLYTVDSRIQRVEQQMSLSLSTASRPTDTRDVELLRSQISLLERRLSEIDCALVKLDERTLSPAAREARKSTATADPCRLNAGTPLRLSSRP